MAGTLRHCRARTFVQEGTVQCVVDLEKAGEAMHVIYVYFYQAVKHLMYYGVLKRCKRRSGRFWKREIFPPDMNSFAL